METIEQWVDHTKQTIDLNNLTPDYSANQMQNLQVVTRKLQFDRWFRLDIHFIFSTMKWWRWN